MPCGCRFGLVKVNVSAYADDVVLLASSMTAHQNLVNKFVNIAILYELKIYVQKTCFMNFNDKFNRSYNSVILIKDQRVTREDSFKYLDCFITEICVMQTTLKGLCVLLTKVSEFYFENFIHSTLNHFILHF